MWNVEEQNKFDKGQYLCKESHKASLSPGQAFTDLGPVVDDTWRKEKKTQTELGLMLLAKYQWYKLVPPVS